MRRIINGKTYDTKKSKLVLKHGDSGAESKVRKINAELRLLSAEQRRAAVESLSSAGNLYISCRLYKNPADMYYAVITMAVLRQTHAVGDSDVAMQYNIEYVFVPIRRSRAEAIIEDIERLEERK